MKALVIVDMLDDFVTGALAKAGVPEGVLTDSVSVIQRDDWRVKWFGVLSQ